MTQSIPDEYILDVVADGLDRGETDLLMGGVPVPVVARELGVTRDTAKQYLLRLAADGQLVRVDGANPDTLRGRMSFRFAEPDPFEIDLGRTHD